jgi:hypothetical protein
MTIRVFTEMTKVAWVRDPSAPAGQPADGTFTCPCGTATGPRPFAGPQWACAGCTRRYDGRGWLLGRGQEA